MRRSMPGLIDIEPGADGALAPALARTATPATLERDRAASRRTAAREPRHPLHRRADCASGASVVTDIVAPLPHDFESGGLRRLAGLTYRDVRESVLKDMYGLFDDDPRLGPSLQAQLFAYSGLGALAALPVSLSELLPNPYEFRVAGATAFQGMDSLAELRAAGTEAHRERQAARQVRDAARELAVVARASAAVDDARALVFAEQVAEESRAARLRCARAERLHARAADSAQCSRRVRVELDRVLRVRAADGARLSRLSAADDGAVDRGRRGDAPELADSRRVRPGRADDAQQARLRSMPVARRRNSARWRTASRRSTSTRTARWSAKAARAC